MTNRVRAVLLAALGLLLIRASLAQGVGDAVRGNTLYNATYRCFSCHNKPAPNTSVASGATVDGILAAIAGVSEMRTRFAALASNQVDLADLAAFIAQTVGVPAPVTAAIEYYHAEFDHYFITSDADEIAKLDAGAFAGWERTGLQFNVYGGAEAGALVVCRFFSTAFAPKSSHFYTPVADECAALKSGSVWSYEGNVFYVVPANADGSCSAGTQAVYRLYNDGQGGAPNHRYATSADIADQMTASGWVMEGNGPYFAFMCVPI